MEIVRKNISMNHICGRSQTQITLDDDFIVPDSKPDILKRIADCGEVIIEGMKAGDGRASVNGKMQFSLLYQGEGRTVWREALISVRRWEWMVLVPEIP